MNKFNKLTIETKGANSEPDLKEVNELGLSGWRLIDVRAYCGDDVIKYTYQKRKWWALF